MSRVATGPTGAAEATALSPSQMDRGRAPRVVLAPSQYAPHVGGVEEHVRQLARVQLERGADPMVVTMRWPADLPAHEQVDGVTVRRFAFRPPEGRIRDVVRGAATSPWSVTRLASVLRAHRAELVNVQCVSPSAWHVGWAARRAGLPLVVSLHGELNLDAEDVYGRSSLLRRTLRRLLAEAVVVTGCSQAVLDDVEVWWGRPLGERGVVVPNGIRLDDLAGIVPARHPRPYLFAAGRLVPQKGFADLLSAFAAIDPARRGVDLLIAGEGPLRPVLERTITDRGVQGSVHLLGVTDRRRTLSLFLGAEAFVLSSHGESFGIVNLEAMASGRPVVATAVGGVPEVVVDGETGVLVAPDDPDALALGMARVLDDPGLAGRLGAAGRRRARTYAWEGIADRYDELYRQVLAGRGVARLASSEP